MSHAFMAIAEQMGQVLRRTALSTNMRERLTSCAVFDREGGLVANAPHIPVHLGAMSESVQAVLREHPSSRPGTLYVTNDPARGGSIYLRTVVARLHDAVWSSCAFVRSRGLPGGQRRHHAWGDAGLLAILAEEGVVFQGFV